MSDCRPLRKRHSPRSFLKTALLVLPVAVAPTSVQSAPASKSVIIVLDASGSMRAKLSDGTVRINAAKAAVRNFVEQLDPGIRLALRAYGHRSPTREKNCRDTALVVGFDAAKGSASKIVAALPGIEARGYTPITEVLGLAADDIRNEPSKQRVVVLVSDGKETCAGDPCATARKLAQANANLVIHSIGFAVDAAAKLQLQCIARIAGGRYFDAASAGELARSLNQAIAAPRRVASEKKTTAPKPGYLKVKGADRHKVLDAETGAEVTELSFVADSKPLKPGLYNVTVGGGIWKSVEVRAGGVTELQPGVLKLRSNGARKVEVVDPETGESLATLDTRKNRAVLIPTRYVVMFGEVPSPEIRLEPGQTLTFNNATVTLGKAPFGTYALRDRNGRVAGNLNASFSSVVVPAGNYQLAGKGKTVSIEVREGEDLTVNIE